ncbi:hypothetical protein ABIE67_009915 [Streptomyces sp. V4I8]
MWGSSRRPDWPRSAVTFLGHYGLFPAGWLEQGAVTCGPSAGVSSARCTGSPRPAGTGAYVRASARPGAWTAGVSGKRMVCTSGARHASATGFTGNPATPASYGTRRAQNTQPGTRGPVNAAVSTDSTFLRSHRRSHRPWCRKPRRRTRHRAEEPGESLAPVRCVQFPVLPSFGHLRSPGQAACDLIRVKRDLKIAGGPELPASCQRDGVTVSPGRLGVRPGTALAPGE